MPIEGTLVYRVESNFRHDRDTTIGDMIDYEQHELGNTLVVHHAVLAQVRMLPASRCHWVCLKSEDAEQYLKDEQDLIYMTRLKNLIVVAEDNHGGILAYLPASDGWYAATHVRRYSEFACVERPVRSVRRRKRL